MNKYGRLEEEEAPPPPYSEIAQPPPQQPHAPAAPSVTHAGTIPAYLAPPGTYVITRNVNGAPTPVVRQPGVVYVQAPIIPEHEAPDYLCMAILVTMCCCLPLGIVAVIKANQCRSARLRGDRKNALLNGRDARKFSLIGLGCGIAIIVLVLALYGIIIGMAIAQAHQMNN